MPSSFQILAELHRVERELQEKATAQMILSREAGEGSANPPGQQKGAAADAAALQQNMANLTLDEAAAQQVSNA